MKIRLISGSAYIAILALFFCLKIFLPAPYGTFAFDALIYAFTLIGTMEMLRAMQEKTTKASRGLVLAFAIVTIPACAVSQYVFEKGFLASALCLGVLALALLSLLVFAHEETTIENLGVSLLSAVYPVLFLALLVLCNHEAGVLRLAKFGFDSRLMLLMIFVISPCADSIAYVFGCFLRKYFPKKLAPKLSPNKTVIGGIGGLVGGMLGAAALYFIYNATAGSYDKMLFVLPVYMGIGLLAAIATAFGDLVESCIKRKVGLKDMGKIMPGHGGALDRLDGTFFATVVVYAAFQLIFLFI